MELYICDHYMLCQRNCAGRWYEPSTKKLHDVKPLYNGKARCKEFYVKSVVYITEQHEK